MVEAMRLKHLKGTNNRFPTDLRKYSNLKYDQCAKLDTMKLEG